MQKFFDAEIEKLGIVDAKFPLFVNSDDLRREKDHIDGFAPEVSSKFIWHNEKSKLSFKTGVE